MSLADIWDFIINVNIFYVFGGFVALMIFGWISDQPSMFGSYDEDDKVVNDDENSKNDNKSKGWLNKKANGWLWLIGILLLLIAIVIGLYD